MDARSLFLTPNSTTVYNFAELDVKDGPIVMEVPPGVLGPIDDAFFRWVADVGVTGADQGKGGKYLVMHNSYKGEIPEGYFVVKTPSFRNLVLYFIPSLRAITALVRQELEARRLRVGEISEGILIVARGTDITLRRFASG